ncbi:MAG: hypothetical protein HY006_00710 [Candidatus Sungbacteria bacterium]|nr:hypothetical protein [Candidatus Sungbacteria bacterium]
MRQRNHLPDFASIHNDDLAAFKRSAQGYSKLTAEAIKHSYFQEIPESRGESAYLLQSAGGILAQVVEGVGTKIRVAETVYRETGELLFANVAQDAVAMIVNDMITSGVPPAVVGMFLAAGSVEWFRDRVRYLNLLDGWARACVMAGCVSGGGETAILSGFPSDAIVLGGASAGIAAPGKLRITGAIHDRDAIVLLASSGIHSNGLTFARAIAEYKDSWLRRIGHVRRLPAGCRSPSFPTGIRRACRTTEHTARRFLIRQSSMCQWFRNVYK